MENLIKTNTAKDKKREYDRRFIKEYYKRHKDYFKKKYEEGKGQYLYIFKSPKNRVTYYIGSCSNIRTRVNYHINGFSNVLYDIGNRDYKIEFLDVTNIVKNKVEREFLEKYLIFNKNPLYNIKLGFGREVISKERQEELIFLLEEIISEWIEIEKVNN